MMDATEIYTAIEQYRDEPFQWGSHDCCMFAANIIRDISGVDYAKSLRGRYRTKVGATRIIKKHGGLTPLLSKLFGVDPVPPMLARRGWPALANVGDQDAAGVCVGSVCVFVGVVGLVFVPLADTIATWSID